ncbi:hypothetical protein [Flavobacterium sp. DG2-3]|uniref:hypothetical protein n=1 Tax=Flavobacterium sp. DG2-3 TaxID=3068317 RepID=UPI00273D110E|nr:hypothetical protein [Flavobacterium sp. DG2-3]MDP5198469.1 hypothetical protein [Flavobacterium sp. DG2-3]
MSESEFEKEVLNSVFVEIVDSIHKDRRIMLPPPSPKYSDFKTGKRDTVGYGKILKKYWHDHDSIKKDKRRKLIAVYGFLKNNGINDNKFDLAPFKNNKKYDFQYMSKFPDEISWDLNDIKSSLPVGTISISGIRFNKTKTSGILEASSSAGGGKSGSGFEITIEKKSGEWHISKIIDTWVS